MPSKYKAKAIRFDNIDFKSILEKDCYKLLKENGFTDVKYEPVTFPLLSFPRSITPFYDKETEAQHKKRIKEDKFKKSPKLLHLKSYKIQPITYTPDFYIKYKGLDVWIECKGKENDRFYLIKKLFRRYLDFHEIDTKQKSFYCEVYSKKQMQQAINLFKDYADEIISRN